MEAVKLTKRRDNVYPLRPAQASLFGEPVVANTNQPTRLNPRKALLRFGVRKDFASEVPLVKPKQLGLSDGEDRHALAQVAAHGVPLSERAILRVIEGSDVSGHKRAEFSQEVDEAVESYFHACQATYGFDVAVVMLFSMLSGSPDYMQTNPPTWVLQLFADERALLVEVFAGHKDDRRVDPAGPGDADEGDE